MAKFTLQQLYLGDKYNIMGEAFKTLWFEDPIDEEMKTAIELAIVKATIAVTIKMINEGDFISEFESEMRSLSLCLEVKLNEHNS